MACRFCTVLDVCSRAALEVTESYSALNYVANGPSRHLLRPHKSGGYRSKADMTEIHEYAP
jgi:hypothetical protein